MQLVRAEQNALGLWTILVAGDGMGPARAGHIYGWEISGPSPYAGTLRMIDFLTQE